MRSHLKIAVTVEQVTFAACQARAAFAVCQIWLTFADSGPFGAGFGLSQTLRGSPCSYQIRKREAGISPAKREKRQAGTEAPRPMLRAST